MSWLDDEMPMEWPQKESIPSTGEGEGTTSTPMEFSTSRSGSDGTIAPTVAVQSSVEVKSPPWKKPFEDAGRGPLTRLFIPPADLRAREPRPHGEVVPNENDPSDDSRSTIDNATNVSTVLHGPEMMHSASMPNLDPTADKHSGSSMSTSASSSGSVHTTQSEADMRDITRKLKVFGPPDTYTNERFGDLLHSVAGVGRTLDGRMVEASRDMKHNPSPDVLSQRSRGRRPASVRAVSGAASSRSGRTNLYGDTSNASQSESDQDLNKRLQREGQQLLQGLAPYQPELPTVPESSLDQLELQLTSQGTDMAPRHRANHTEFMHASSTIDTTSSASQSSGKTLETLAPMGSHWDAFPKYGELNQRSTDKHTRRDESPRRHAIKHLTPKSDLGRSGGTATTSTAVSTETRTRNMPLDVSELNIAEPMFVDLSQENTLPRIGTQFSTSGDDSIFATRQIRPSEQPPMPVEASSMLRFEDGVSDINSPPSGSVLETHRVRPARSSEAPRTDLKEANNGDKLPPLPQPTPLQSFMRRPKHSGAINDSSELAKSAEANDTINLTFLSRPQKVPQYLQDHSQATFSYSYRDLLRLIRERSDVDVDKFHEITSLDLSGCELETIVGLDEICPTLNTLFLNNNNLKTLYGLPPSVVNLDLSENELDGAAHFPASFISMLILRNNNLKDLQCLRNLRALSSLDVSDNKLETTRGIESLTALRYLNLSNNQLRALELSIGTLTELEAANNHISAVNLQMPDLEMLQLENNAIVVFNEWLPVLKGFNIRYNDAVLDMAGCKNLETLLFDGNKAIKNFTPRNLRTFSWEQCRANTEINVDLVELRRCRDVKLTLSNPTKKDSTQSPRLHPAVYSAQHLDLAASGLDQLPENFARMFPFLRSLNLAFNNLSDDCISILRRCRSLRRLSLFGNRLTVTGVQLTEMLPQVVVLDTRGQNSHAHIPSSVFATTLYAAIMNRAPESQTGDRASSNVEWLDGVDFGLRKLPPPAFPSALFPETVNVDDDDLVDTVEESSRSPETPLSDETTALDAVMSDEEAKWDFVKSIYLHYYLQSTHSAGVH